MDDHILECGCALLWNNSFTRSHFSPARHFDLNVSYFSHAPPSTLLLYSTYLSCQPFPILTHLPPSHAVFKHLTSFTQSHTGKSSVWSKSGLADNKWRMHMGVELNECYFQRSSRGAVLLGRAVHPCWVTSQYIKIPCSRGRRSIPSVFEIIFHNRLS